MILSEIQFGMIADWLIVVGTLVLAAVAIWQQTIHAWFYRPKLRVSIATKPPDCVKVPFSKPGSGQHVADAIYLRMWVENVGNASATNAEVYAKELHRERADHEWEKVDWFSPMNLRWANGFGVYFPSIAPEMGKHCDLGHITDPARRAELREDSDRLRLSNEEVSLAFDLIERPNHYGHIIGPGNYRLSILVAAQNLRPECRTITIFIKGPWALNEEKMLSDNIGVSVE